MRVWLTALIVAVSMSFIESGGASAQTRTSIAASEYESQCRAGDSEACWVVGRWYKGGIKMPLDQAKAESLLNRACDLGNGKGCDELNDLRRSRRLADPSSAIELLESECRAGKGRSCLEGAQRALDGAPGLASDAGKARDLTKRACDLNEARGCNAFSMFAAEGKGGARDVEAAISAGEKACRLSMPSGCLVAAQMLHQSGRSGRAVDLAEQACKAKAQPGCAIGAKLAVAAISPPDGTRALKLAQTGCADKDAESCLVSAAIQADGKFLPVNAAAAREASAKACELKSVDGCGLYLQLAETAEHKLTGLNGLCVLKQADACVARGRMFEEGEGIPVNTMAAMNAYQRALRINADHAEAKSRLEAVKKKPVS